MIEELAIKRIDTNRNKESMTDQVTPTIDTRSLLTQPKSPNMNKSIKKELNMTKNLTSMTKKSIPTRNPMTITETNSTTEMRNIRMNSMKMESSNMMKKTMT